MKFVHRRALQSEPVLCTDNWWWYDVLQGWGLGPTGVAGGWDPPFVLTPALWIEFWQCPMGGMVHPTFG